MKKNGSCNHAVGVNKFALTVFFSFFIILSVHFHVNAGGFYSGYYHLDIPDLRPVTNEAEVSVYSEPVLMAMPSRYNSYENGSLPVIRDQGMYGMCWTFSSIGSVESDLIHDRLANTDINLSELQLGYYATHTHIDPKGLSHGTASYTAGMDWMDNGGNEVIAYRLMSNNIGPVYEADIPYPADDTDSSAITVPDEYAKGHNAAQLKGAYIIYFDDRAGIKKAIVDHGGVATSFYWSSSSYSETYNSFYSTFDTPNHAVMLVGWDDGFSRSLFRETAPGDGAWLVRNSWGVNGYDQDGYFWISYYDGGLLSSDYVVAFDADTDLYDNCYSYDGSPYSNTFLTIPCEYSADLDMMVSGGEEITAVGFETYTPDMQVSARISFRENGAETASYVKTIRTTYAGFYTIPFGTPIEVAEDSTVYISLSFDCDEGEYTILAEPQEGLNSFTDTYYRVVTDHGFDLTDEWGSAHYDYDPRIKLYTCNINSEPAPEESCLMYRLYNPNSGEHFYTGSIEERQTLTDAGWIYEGNGWNAPLLSGEPVYRLYNPNAGDHHYTPSVEEREMLIDAGWNYEGVAWNSATGSDASPLYRLYNPNAVSGAHHYTMSEEERDHLISLGWRYEGIGWFGL